MSQKTNPRESLDVLKTYPAFQVMRAKAETHQLQFRPKETSLLRKNGTLNRVLDLRTEIAWNILGDCRRGGMHQNEAEEIGLPSILLLSESQEEEIRLDQEEQMKEQMDGQ